MASHDDRRRHHRHDTRFSLQLGPDERAEPFATEGLNISMGGIYCRVPRFIPMMTKLRATLILPLPAEGNGGEINEEILEVDMVVVWTDPEAEIPGIDGYQIGCSFLPLEDEEKNLLQRYLDFLAEKAMG
ncbi:MAG: PilZ domain-containing protein [Candidatus Eisenbacteria bacterium]